jgi:hypothetical protein
MGFIPTDPTIRVVAAFLLLVGFNWALNLALGRSLFRFLCLAGFLPGKNEKTTASIAATALMVATVGGTLWLASDILTPGLGADVLCRTLVAVFILTCLLSCGAGFLLLGVDPQTKQHG